MKCLRVTPDNFAALWGQIKPMLEDACRRSNGRFTPDGCIARTVEGLWQVWVAIDDEGVVYALAATEILVFPDTGLKVGNIIITTGHHREKWKGMIDDLAEWFITQGCTEQQTLARKGWARELSDFRLTHVLLERTI